MDDPHSSATRAIAPPANADTLEAQYTGLEWLPDTPHGCYDGYVYIGYVVEDESGVLVEIVGRVPSRRCHHG